MKRKNTVTQCKAGARGLLGAAGDSEFVFSVQAAGCCLAKKNEASEGGALMAGCLWPAATVDCSV